MYYLYKKSKSVALPKFTYIFKKFSEFYDIADVLTIGLVSNYTICIKSESYNDIMEFLSMESKYTWLDIYIETSQSLIDYILLRKPTVRLLTSKSNYETFEELIARYNILFDKGCIRILYSAIEHDYNSMVEALDLVVKEYPDKKPVTKDDLNKLFVIENIIYPRTICILYLRLDRWRYPRAVRCVEYFGNDLVFYAMRKNVKKFLEEKIAYLKTGKGSGLIKTIPVNNIVRLYHALHYGCGNSKDILTILSLYEKGVTINDIVQERALSNPDA